MKKSMINLFILVIAGVILLSGCNQTNAESNNQNDTVIGSKLIKYDLQGTSDFGFNVNLVSKSKTADVKFVSFWGENTQGLSVKLSDDTYDEIKSMKYNGYYIKLLGFVCKTGDEFVQIDGVTLNIDGVEQKIEFAAPIKHQVKKEASDTSVQIRNYPIFISSNSYGSTEYPFEYYAENDVIIEGFDFNNFIDIKSCVISVNGETVGDLSSFPISVKKDSTVSFKCYLEHKESTSDYDSIYCDSMLSYKITGSDQTTVLYNNLVSQSVSDKDDAKKAIDLLKKQT